MAIDRTAEFRAKVNSLQIKNGESPDEKEINLKTKEPIPFFETARCLLKPIGSLHSFLRSQKSDYLNPHKYVSTLASKMTNTERDQLEEESASQIKRLNEKIQSLKKSIVRIESKKDLQAHQHAIIILLFDRLNQVQMLMNEMKKRKNKTTERRKSKVISLKVSSRVTYRRII